jgi:NAD(P)-dependent dehydrogenase (short-subunit alcohol dehydrogenase family)
VRVEGVALVTGASQGIGRAIALALATHGADVAVAARSLTALETVAAEIEAVGRHAVAVTCDVTSSASVDQAMARTREALGPIRILVNNAGISSSAPLSRLDEKTWRQTLDVNLTGTYLCTRAALGDMLTRASGRVINVASIAGRVGFAYTAAYCASKHGVLGFTRAIALEVARSGITVNAICPGWVDTDMTVASIGRIAVTTGRSEMEARRVLEAMSPQRRLIRPEEVAAVAVFLASDDAAGITGQALDVDGGEVMA